MDGISRLVKEAMRVEKSLVEEAPEGVRIRTDRTAGKQGK